MLNVGFIVEGHFPQIGGLEYSTHFLVENLNNIQGVSSAVACGSLSNIPQDFKYSYPCYRSKSFSVLTPWLSKKNREKMILNESIQILHGQMLHGGGYNAMGLSRKFNLPFVVQSHGADVQVVPEINYGALIDPTQFEKIKMVIKEADKLVAVSSINKQNMIDLGANPDKIDIVHNGVDVDKINKIPYCDLRAQFGLKATDFVIITVGRNKPIKRMDLLFKALRKLKDFKSIKCICVGPKQNLQKLAQEHGVNDQVIFAGSIPKNINYNTQPPFENLINAYRSSNLYISTSYLESFGNAAAEALACGIPIIIGGKHGIRDIICEGKTGWVMSNDTSDNLAELIVSLYEKRLALIEGSEIFKSSVAHLTWENIAHKMNEVYRKVL